MTTNMADHITRSKGVLSKTGALLIGESVRQLKMYARHLAEQTTDSYISPEIHFHSAVKIVLFT